MTSISILFSHHILSSKKKLAIRKLCCGGICILLKSGTPGLIVVEGDTNLVTRATRCIVGMRWQYMTTLVSSTVTRGTDSRPLYAHLGTSYTEVVKMRDLGHYMTSAGYQELYKSAIQK